MYNTPYTKKEKISAERDISEFIYESNLNWKFMKKLKSNTGVRAWHIKVDNTHYRLIQSCLPRLGERLCAYPASRGGSVIEYGKPLFDKYGLDWLHGLEYLLRYLEGEDISKLKLK
jgi:hypothetical protein